MDILRAILLSLESMIEDPELQVNGFILIIDWSNFTFKQASKLTPSMLRLAIEGLQVGPSTYIMALLPYRMPMPIDYSGTYMERLKLGGHISLNFLVPT